MFSKIHNFQRYKNLPIHIAITTEVNSDSVVNTSNSLKSRIRNFGYHPYRKHMYYK